MLSCNGFPAFADGKLHFTRVRLPDDKTVKIVANAAEAGEFTSYLGVAPPALPNSVNQSAFIKISKITNSLNPSETVSPDLAVQDIAGRVAPFNPASATMPDLDAAPVSSVDVEFTVGPCPAFPAGKDVTLVVTPLDPAQGTAVSYTSAGPINCASPPTLPSRELPFRWASALLAASPC